jgi:hypothetical protein
MLSKGNYLLFPYMGLESWCKTLQCFDVTGCDTEYSSVLHLIDKCETLRYVEYTYNDPEDVSGNYNLDIFSAVLIV